MDLDRLRVQRRQGSRQPLERRVDKWIETGRQVVDGVAGNRPGMRKPTTSRSGVNNFEKVGRWVGDKLDWFLEEEDGWLEPWQTNDQETYVTSKRPLEAVSLRVSQTNTSSSTNTEDSLVDAAWPEESSFRVERWQRNDQITENINSQKVPNKRRESIGSSRRPLPRSSRRRD